MNLLAILFALFIERMAESLDKYRELAWIINFSNWAKQKFSEQSFWHDTGALVVIILLPVFACGVIYEQLGDMLAILGFTFAILVLVYSLGPKRLLYIAKQYVESADQHDSHGVNAAATEILQDAIPDEDSVLNRRISDKLFTGLAENLFAVIFWFIILGPVGALLVRISATLYYDAIGNNEEEFQDFTHSTQILYGILLWPGAQLTALGFAVTGSFVDGFQRWKDALFSNDFVNPMDSLAMLTTTGWASLQLEPDSISFDASSVADVLSLCWRTVVLLVTLIALLTLAGWAT